MFSVQSTPIATRNSMSTTSSPGRRPLGKPALSPPSTPRRLCEPFGTGGIAVMPLGTDYRCEQRSGDERGQQHNRSARSHGEPRRRIAAKTQWIAHDLLVAGTDERTL